MDDLISRKAAIAFANDQIKKETGAYSKGRNTGIRVMKSALNNPDAIPSVPAVPLDKLCKCLSRNAWAFDCEGCEEYCKAMVECENDVGNNPEYWKDKLINWMEEQDAEGEDAEEKS